MACERVGITVLVVDDDDANLVIVANILSSWEYKVLTANNAHNALEALREFEGFFDIVITELHMSGMNGFEFQKHVKEEFQLPIIMMSADSRESVMSKSLENGASHYIVKPICSDDFKDIWQYAMAARKGKLAIENELNRKSGEGNIISGDKIIFHDVKNFAVTLREPKRRKRCSKRKCNEMNKEDQCEGSFRAQKKPKVVWTTCLHNLFLLSIKQIGLDKAVPKKILEIMNVPNLTRENVASHLQKYRIFLRKVAERGIIEGLSDRALRSRFASGLSTSVIRDIQSRIEKLSVPVQQYLKRSAQQTGNVIGAPNAVNPSNNSTYVTQIGNGHFSNPMHRGLMLQNQQTFNSDSLNQVRLGQQSSFNGSNNLGTNNLREPMLGSHAGPVFPAYGSGHGLMTSSNGLTGSLEYAGDSIYQNYGSLGNHHSFSYGLGNGSPLSSNCFPKSNYSGTQLMNGRGNDAGFNSVGIQGATANNNSIGLINGTFDTNLHVAPIRHGNSDLIQGGSASSAAFGNGSVSEVPSSLIFNNANGEDNDISGLPPLPQQLDGLVGNGGNEIQYKANSMSEGETGKLEDDLTGHFLMLDDMHLLNETEENPTASEFLDSDVPNPGRQSLEQPQTVGDVVVPASKSSINLPKERSASPDKSLNQDWDMELIEAFFGITEPNQRG